MQSGLMRYGQFAVTWYLEDQVKEELAENGAETADGGPGIRPGSL